MESDFGRNIGKFNAFQTLLTLAFDGRRSKYFREELISLLKIVDNGKVVNKNIKSGWAGAMGQSQFMPSSFLAFAQDCDGDGILDHACSNENNRWLVLSSEGCPNSWGSASRPASKCPQAFGGTYH